MYDHVLQNTLMQTPHVTEPDYEIFPHQSSSVDQNLSALGTPEKTKPNV